MFKSKYVTSVAAGVVLASSIFMSSSALAAKNFTDLNSDSSHEPAVKYLNQNDVFDYKTTNQLNGQAAVTRGEAAQILHKLFNGIIPPERQYNNNFKDVNSKTQFSEAIKWAYESKIFDGDAKGNFNPQQTLTRAQMAKVLVNAYLIETDGTASFKDVPNNHWAYEYINILGAEGISVGSNGNFMPNNKVTLNQLSSFIYRIESDQVAQGIKPQEEPQVTVTNPFYPQQEEKKLELKTPEEVLAMAVAMYESSEFEPEMIEVLTKEDVDNTLRKFTGGHIDLAPYLNGYNTYGRTLMVSSVPTTGGYKTSIWIQNDRDQEGDQEYKAKIANSVEYIKANYDLSSDYKTVKAVVEFVSAQLTYGESVPENHQYLGWYGGGKCETYTNAVASILTSFGIENRIIAGGVKGAHVWNAVKLDSNWYYADATFYDTGGNNPMNFAFTQSQADAKGYQIDTDFRASNVPYNKQ